MSIRPNYFVGTVILTCLTLAGCAKPPGSITPVSVSSMEFEHLSCKDLAQEIKTNRDELAEAERLQRNAVVADAAGVFFVLIPPSAFTGDAEDEVAIAKGNEIALQRSWDKRCT